METDVVYLPDDEAHVPPEDLSALLAEGTSASVMEFCARGPSAALLLGCMLLAAATLIAAIRFTWHVYAEDIAEFYCEAAGSDGTGPLFQVQGAQEGLVGDVAARLASLVAALEAPLPVVEAAHLVMVSGPTMPRATQQQRAPPG
eukprot:CAMPEP_0171114950 /NCGR_PEP_ID=MMETSP0766_2-20121228/86586_1 /TAXON_ID=439317 /ORGANISM="Gambierdiscus australes, Strain CAWD 149" /LENGTH=144 /DNA_ID=CAMNT_0011577269 /DNA_START=73 /DNA_END=504 /DNA_ORIENTATION=-